MIEIKNLKEAFEYINSRYSFTDGHYPIMHKLTRQEKIYFAFKHILLHMQKSILIILQSEKNNFKAKEDIRYRQALTKMIVNLIALSYEAELDHHEILSLPTLPVVSENLSIGFLELMQKVAKECEEFDHFSMPQAQLTIPELQVREAIRKLWAKMIDHNSSYWENGFSIEQSFSEIPLVMKS